MTDELARRLQNDLTALHQFCKAIGLDPEKLNPEGLQSISELFPDTPIKLLRDVFEELQLYDLVEFLAKVKPRTLLLSVPLKEIRESLNASERATKFYHKAKVLIIEYIDEQSAVETCFKNIGSFFEALHPESQITGVTVKVFRTTDKRYRQFEVSKGKRRSKLPESKERGNYDQGASGKKIA